MAPSWIPSLPFGKQKEDRDDNKQRSLSKKRSIAEFSVRQNRFLRDEEEEFDRELYPQEYGILPLQNQYLPRVNTGKNIAADLTLSISYIMSTPINPEQLAGAPLAAASASAGSAFDLASPSSKAGSGLERKTIGSTLKAKVTKMVAIGNHGRGGDINALASTTDRSGIIKPESLVSNNDTDSIAPSEAPKTSGSLDHVLRTNKGDVYGNAAQRGLNIAHQLARHRHKRNITPFARDNSVSSILLRRSVSQNTGTSSKSVSQASTSSRRHSAVADNLVLSNTITSVAAEKTPAAIDIVTKSQLTSVGPSAQVLVSITAATKDQPFTSMVSARSQTSLTTASFPSFHQSVADEYMRDVSVFNQDKQGSETGEDVLSRIDEGVVSEGQSTEVTTADSPEFEGTAMCTSKVGSSDLAKLAKNNHAEIDGLKLKLSPGGKAVTETPITAIHITAEQINDALVNGSVVIASGQKIYISRARTLPPADEEIEFTEKDLDRHLLGIACFDYLIETNPDCTMYKAKKEELIANKRTEKGKSLVNEAVLGMIHESATASVKALKSTLAEKEVYIQDCHDRFDDDDDLIERLKAERKKFRNEVLAANTQVALGQSKIEELETRVKMVARDKDNDCRGHSNTVIRLEREKQAISLQVEAAETAAKDAQELLACLKAHSLNYKKKCELGQKKDEESAAVYRKICDEEIEFLNKKYESALKEKTEKHVAQLALLEADHKKLLDGYKKDCEKMIATEKAWAVGEVKEIERKKEAALEIYDKECKEALAREHENSLASLKNTDAKQLKFFQDVEEEYKMQLELEQEKTAAAIKELEKLESEHKEALKSLEDLELKYSNELKDRNDEIQCENEDFRDNYEYYRSYFLAQQAVYRQHNFGNWDAGAQDRIEAAGGVYVRPEGMPLRNSEMEEHHDSDEDFVEIFDGENIQVVSPSAYNIPGSDGGDAQGGGSGSGEVDA